MCNLYSVTKGPQAIREAARAMRDTTGRAIAGELNRLGYETPRSGTWAAQSVANALSRAA